MRAYLFDCTGNSHDLKSGYLSSLFYLSKLKIRRRENRHKYMKQNYNCSLKIRSETAKTLKS
jgi:hypothetical protein